MYNFIRHPCVRDFHRPLNREVLFHQEAKNESEDYIPAPWVPTFEVQTTAAHTFTLKELKDKDDAVVRGCEFMVNPIEPIHFEVEGCPTLHTGGVMRKHLPFIS